MKTKPKPNKHSLGPCSVCGRARLVDTGEDKCTKHSPKYYMAQQKKAYARRLAAGKFRAVARIVGGQHSDPDRVPIKRCDVCSDLPWRRALKGKCKCGRRYAPEAPITRAPVLGSSLATGARIVW